VTKFLVSYDDVAQSLPPIVKAKLDATYAAVGDLAAKVATTDPRLSDARTPVAHTQAASTITDFNAATNALILAAAVVSAGRNRIINGDFRINQRAYASAATLAVGAYSFDRWKSTTAATSLTFTAAPQGQTVTINSGGSVAQIIERANIGAGTFTLSWAGTATARVYNVGSGAPAYAASPITVTLNGLADVTVEFTATGGAKTVGGVQIESGTTPTPFELIPVGVSLSSCQRYFWRKSSPTADHLIATGVATSSTGARAWVDLPVQMRAVPTFVLSAGTWNMITAAFATVAATAITIETGYTSVIHAVLACTTASGLVAGNATFVHTTTLGAYFDFAAEL